MKKIILGLVLLSALALIWLAIPAQPVFSQDSIIIHTDTAQERFSVELAVTPRQQEHGLMFRTSLAEKHGMLFVFPESRPISMWMKNTLIPLDMLFIDERGRIVHIARNAMPESRENISAPQPARAVLELAGGSADAYHIGIGHRVEHRLFTP